MSSSFDPTNAVEFDLRNGSVSAPRGGAQRLVLVPADALDELVRVGGPVMASALGLLIGASCGTRAATRLGGAGAVSSASLESVSAQLGGELSLAGIGTL